MYPPLDFETVFDCAPNPYMLLAPDLTFVGANEAYLRATASRREDLLGRNLFEVFPGDPHDDTSARQLRASLERVLAERRPDTLALIRYVIPRQTPEGLVYDERYWSATHTPILDEQGAVRLILQHTVDVTELQQLKQALRAAEQAADEATHQQVEETVFRRAQAVQETNWMLDAERRHLRRLFEQAPGFIAILNGPKHVFQLVNAAYHQLIGRRNVVGRPVREALPEIAGQGFLDLLDRVYTSGEPYIGHGMSVLLQRQTGAPLEEVYVDFVYQPLIEPDGSVSGIFVQGSDVTAQKRAQAELHELNESLEQRVAQRTAELEARNRELQEFAYVVSHDLQEPLRKVHAFADVVLEDYAGTLDAEGQAYLHRIQDGTRRMSLLIQDLLAYSRITTQARDFKRIDLGQVAQEVIGDLQLRIDETGGRVEVGTLPTIDAEPSQMRQLLQNLIGNALKFHRPGVPPVVVVEGPVKTGEDGRAFCRLEVRDNGIGFSQQYADRIFAPFQRLHTRDRYEGTGIGLAICRRIAERHQGAISAESSPGEGSTFVVRLPVEQPKPDEAAS